MALEAKLVQKLSQSLLMTPQLQQAIKLLQLGRLEYKEAIEQELLENPVLEARDEEEAPPQQNQGQDQSSPDGDMPTGGEQQAAEEAPSPEPADLLNKGPVEWEDYLESFSDSRGSATPRGMVDHDDRPQAEASANRGETLQEHLVQQIRMSELAASDSDIVFNVVGNLNKDGYLCSTYDEIAASCGCPVDDVSRVMEVIKSFDPPGVGARDLSECLLIQLEHLGLGNGLEAKIVRDHLEKLERRKYDDIAKTEHVEVEKVYRAVTAIQSLEPRPGRPFVDEETRYVVPDIFVSKVGNEYVISLNEDGLPKLRVSPYYLQLLRSKDTDNLPNRAYLTERLKAASWLIKSIHQRQQTIYRVTESIVKFQKEFLDHGISKLKPLILKDVANDIGMHESTVSRVTANKYVHTPQGVFELRFFFTTGIKTDAGEVSSSSIKEKIRAIIAAEPPSDPISDQAIVDVLKKENVDIARRTVAKYRESLNIPSSSKRKKLF